MPRPEIQRRPLLTTSQVAALFFVDYRTISRWRRQGRLTSIKTPGGQYRFDEAEIRALLNGGAK